MVRPTGPFFGALDRGSVLWGGILGSVGWSASAPTGRVYPGVDEPVSGPDPHERWPELVNETRRYRTQQQIIV